MPYANDRTRCIRFRSPAKFIGGGRIEVDYLETGGHFVERTIAQFPDAELLANICRNVRALASAISVPLILENLDYCPGGAYEHICEPAFLAAVLSETGAGLLLDLAHARVSASRLELPIETYLSQLPLDRVRQLHISGPRVRDGVLFDAHEVLLDDDYALLEWVLQRTKPLALTLEYNREESKLRTELERLRVLLRE